MTTLAFARHELLADTETPVSALVKLCGSEPEALLLESGETVENLGRFSVVAYDPLARLALHPDQAVLTGLGLPRTRPAAEFFALARQAQAELDCPGLPSLPAVGSLAGYLGFETVRLIERLPPAPAHHLPVAQLLYFSRFAVFDHLRRLLTLVAIAPSPAEAEDKLTAMRAALDGPLNLKPRKATLTTTPPPRERLIPAVERAKEHILAGDIFQVVLSDRFTGTTDLDPLAAYRWLRVKSPSPYMFFLRLADCTLVGASPETLVRLRGGMMHVRPIAGTRHRGGDPATDLALEREMLASDKECAEHVMLVDLARNDVGRVSQYGSVKVDPYMIVERYSHVMHIVSAASGRLLPGLDAWDALIAGFPAGTVSGAPKVRAMEIITELEGQPRGPYAGAVGFFGPGAQMDTCIAIRMIQFEPDGKVTVQAGAGIVADSLPEMEYQEIHHKAAQGLAALQAAAEGLL